jgi:hypothetical protein
MPVLRTDLDEDTASGVVDEARPVWKHCGMLPLLFAMIVFLFMLVGAVAFLICVALPHTRRFALSTALWWAMWGPCSVALMTLAGLALVADAFISKGGDPHLVQHPRLLATFGWTYLVVGAFLTAVVASIAAWLHQFIVHRFTFMLFRIYATAVVSGIGSVFGWCLCWWLLSRDIGHVWVWSLLGMLLLVASFGVATYRGAQSLRGAAPKKLTWITQEEFTGH